MFPIKLVSLNKLSYFKMKVIFLKNIICHVQYSQDVTKTTWVTVSNKEVEFCVANTDIHTVKLSHADKGNIL